MNILMTSETFLPRIGGAELHIYNLAKELRRCGHTVIIFTNEEGPITKDVIRMKWNKKSLLKIIKILWDNADDVDVIHSHYCYRLALISGIIGKIKGVPVIISLHGMGILDHPNTPFIYQQAHSLYRYLSLKFATHIISTSEDLAKFAYIRVPCNKVSIILSGFDEDLFNKNVILGEDLKEKYKNKKIILTVRRLAPKNGIHYLIEAMPYIIEKIPDIKYIIIGNGGLFNYIKERIRILGISEYVDMVGAQTNDKIPEYLKLANIVVFPSTAESASLACVEAMAMRKPIVASKVGGLIELLGKNEERGKFVKLVDNESSNYDAPLQIDTKHYLNLASVILSVIKEENDKRIDSAYRYAHENLSWRVICKKTINIYNKFIKK